MYNRDGRKLTLILRNDVTGKARWETFLKHHLILALTENVLLDKSLRGGTADINKDTVEADMADRDLNASQRTATWKN